MGEMPNSTPSEVAAGDAASAATTRWRLAWLALGPALLLAWIALVPHSERLTPEAHRLIGVLLLTAAWWITEPIPIPITGLGAVCLAVIVGAVPAEVAGAKARPEDVVLAAFADPTLWFLLGGLFIGHAMSRHGLDRRLALRVLSSGWAARSPMTVIAALGLVVTLISMWTSNTAATAMVYPIGMGVVAVLSGGGSETSDAFRRSRYASALLIMVAYASSVGGVATPIGTATNLYARGVLKRDLNLDIPFLHWTLVGLPLTVALYVGLLAWFRVWLGSKPVELDLVALRANFQSQRESLGPLSRGERNTMLTFLIVITLWIVPGVLAIIEGTGDDAIWYQSYKQRVPESIVALLAPVLLYLLPVDFVRRKFTLALDDLTAIDWGSMILFGSGLSLGMLVKETGLAAAIGEKLVGVSGTESVWAVTAMGIIGAIVLSEFTSNVAACAMLLPVVIGICNSAGLDAVPPSLGVTFGASFGSCLPVSTPPNAIVYGSRLIPLRRMVIAGLGMDLLAATAIWLVLRAAYALGWRAD